MKVAIYGAGAIGGWMGARLAQAGCEVGVVARGATLEALQMHGLRLEASTGSARTVFETVGRILSTLPPTLPISRR